MIDNPLISAQLYFRYVNDLAGYYSKPTEFVKGSGRGYFKDPEYRTPAVRFLPARRFVPIKIIGNQAKTPTQSSLKYPSLRFGIRQEIQQKTRSF